MNSVGIVGLGSRLRILIGSPVTYEQLVEIAEKASCTVDQIEVVAPENFAQRNAELTETFTFVNRPPIIAPEIKDIPEWQYAEPLKFGCRDNAYYDKKMAKRRKKNKNKKTHRR